LPTGAVNRCTVLDQDPRHGGVAALDALEARCGELPFTVIVLTGSGGYHYFFEHVVPDVGNSSNRVGPGLDVRADGGYVLLPPSLHASGRRYEPFSGGEFAAAPDWLIDLMREGVGAGRPVRGNGKRKPASHWRRLLEGIHDGEGRDTALASVAGMLLRNPDVPPDQRLPLLRQFNERHCIPPKSERDIRRIAGIFRRYAR
jgi:putative DNA primase/helicase